MYKSILVAIDLNEESGWRNPLVAAAEQARKFGSEQLIVLTVIREIEALVYAQVGAVGYEMMAHNLENQLAERIREVNAFDLKPKVVVEHGESIYDVILEVAQEAGVDLIVVGSHRPAMKDYLLGTNAGRVVRHASCSVLVARGAP
jgi:nucleotide-binding universal stress UspA family protein